MSRFGLAFSALVMVALASAAYPVLSRGVNAGRLLAARDDPAQLTELGLDDRFDAARAAREIDAALAANDPELADSFVELARERAIAIDSDRLAEVESAKKAAGSAASTATGWGRSCALMASRTVSASHALARSRWATWPSACTPASVRPAPCT